MAPEKTTSEPPPSALPADNAALACVVSALARLAIVSLPGKN